MTRTLTGHLSKCRLRNAKEAAKICADYVREIGFCIVLKRLTDKDAGIVYQGVYSAKLLTAAATTSFPTPGLAISSAIVTMRGLPDGLIDLEVATTL